MNETGRLRSSQLLSLSALALLSPALRLVPGAAAKTAGKAAWLSAPAALPFVLLYFLFLWLFLSKRQPEEGLGELCLRCLGRRAGRFFLLLLGLWLLLYCGFHLRAGAERYLLTVFPHSGSAPFVLTLALLALWAVLGPLRSIGRLSRMLAPPLFALLLFLLLSALPKVDAARLLPLTVYDLPQVLRGALPAGEILALGLLCPCFFLDRTEPLRPLRVLGLLGALSLLLTLLSAAVLGSFGAALTARLRLPFFTLLRNLVFFRSLERMEALAVSLWLFPDLLMACLLLLAATRCLRLAFALPLLPASAPRLSLAGGRWLLPLCVLLAAGLGLLLAPDARSFSRWSEELIPRVNLGAAACFPLAALAGKWKKTL